MHFSQATALAFLAAAVQAGGKAGRTFSVNHFFGDGPLTMGRMDPIINPGVASGHVHAIQGGNAFALTMSDTDALDKSTCTSSRIKNDKSNYWTPSLYFQDPKNGSLISVPMFYMNAYYFFEGTNDKIEAFPVGLRMVSGNPNLRTPPATGGLNILDLADGAPQPVQWTCPRTDESQPLYPVNSDGLHGVGIQDPTNGGKGVGFSDKNCDGYASPLRADVHFPSCYDPSKDVSDYKNNMVWPTNGDCPKGFIHTPHIFYEVYWNTPLFEDMWTPGQGKQPFVLSNGDPTGYGLHGDFISGWDVPTLQQMIDNCDTGDGGMDTCPGLIGGTNDPAKGAQSCNIDNLVPETIFGVMDKLPGNNPIGQWGVNVSPPAGGASSSPAASAPATTKPATSKATSTAKPTASSPAVVTNVADPSTPATAPTLSLEPVKGSSTPKTSKPIKLSTTAPAASPAPTQAGSNPGAGGSNTLVTSYVSETTVIYTTVTMPPPSATPAAGSGTSDVASGWSYKGCFSDQRFNRVLSGIQFANVGQHAVTNTKCVAYCEDAGFSMAGTEYAGQCFCGNELVGSGAVDESQCAMPCEGDESQTCGGSLTLSVYSKEGAKVKARSGRHFHRHLGGASN